MHAESLTKLLCLTGAVKNYEWGKKRNSGCLVYELAKDNGVAGISEAHDCFAEVN